ncbi:MAG: hypothetical protein NT154_32590 [Verrucomicrobia bacterium]|nr:hypothetical protein [Verrucomicrobiota bacterium]
MQPDSYHAVREALAKLGLVGQMKGEDQLIVSAQEGPVWPKRGNSFWLSHKQGTWYLSTWLPAGYRIPSDQDLGAVCSACMCGSSAMYRVPTGVIERFGLQELEDNEYERLFPSD